jgi:hypothetical protein
LIFHGPGSGGEYNKGNDIVATVGGKYIKENSIMTSVGLKNRKYAR